MLQKLKITCLLSLLLMLVSCETSHDIVNGVDEREANEIIVFLASKGISAQKMKTEGGTTAEGAPILLWNISVEEKRMVDALALLNQNGLPRRKSPNLLDLFAKQGLMTTDKEETIRYQAGLEDELRNTIRKIDGVIDADVKISFPSAEETALPGVAKPKIKASVYVKHQGIFDDPNSHLESKIKRLLSGSVNGLEYDSISIIADRARIADVQLQPQAELISGKEKERDMVKIWSVTMSKESVSRFRFLFFLFIFIILGLGGIAAWVIYKFYREMQKSKLSNKEETSEELLPPKEEP